MRIQVNTDHDDGERQAPPATPEPDSGQSRFERWLTRVEVHFSAEALGVKDSRAHDLDTRLPAAVEVGPELPA
ncbi:hypothetical protein [Actinokineospora sp. NBRC 105648]|uniref:hypothetical protein n=1 Tax=Actinokineospora sp. NBRC 105648 TaxID=3032206 RepID=UPI0024A297D7|nr:hypothetical protein [Actinokineospora sp. NBRC 105648]GLZ41166.1 hypothetical protein Acsp05_47900 [Actinokineospora sp. NBRC 105648]